jgi:hypothetical protein
MKEALKEFYISRGRRGRRLQQLLDGAKETRRYWKVKEEALNLAVWRTRCGKGLRPVVRWTT